MRDALSGNLGTFIRPKAKASRPKRNLERRMARRAILPGYPVDPRPFTREEVDAYLSGDHITCLLCGQVRKALGMHIVRVHSVSVDEYKTMYGLPWRRGLAGEATKAAHSANSAQRIAEHDHLREFRHLAITGTPRPAPQYLKDEGTKRILRSIGMESEYPEGTFEEFMRRVSEGRTLKEVSSDEDMPSMSWVQNKTKEDPALETLHRQTIDALPFPIQARMEMLGARFVAAVSKERDAGGGRKRSDKTIGEMLGVSTMVVHRVRKANGVA